MRHAPCMRRLCVHQPWAWGCPSTSTRRFISAAVSVPHASTISRTLPHCAHIVIPCQPRQSRHAVTDGMLPPPRGVEGSPPPALQAQHRPGASLDARALISLPPSPLPRADSSAYRGRPTHRHTVANEVLLVPLPAFTPRSSRPPPCPSPTITTLSYSPTPRQALHASNLLVDHPDRHAARRIPATTAVSDSQVPPEVAP
ncbi:hypothetical protein C8J57DRAFT_544543 [Mycena rebaudengoi]|nr:hypothetical protein C8J57DRAFT_544543 [Mycena rebaudengoi]